MPAPRKTPKNAPIQPAEAAALEAIPAAMPFPAPEMPESPTLPLLKETVEASLGKAAEFQEQIRQAAEDSLEKSKLVYARTREVAEEATTSLSVSLKAVTRGVNDLNVKTVEALQASADAQFAFVKALFATKSVSEMIDLQGEHIRQQIETLNAAAKDLSELIQKVSTESVEPIKSTLSKSLKIAA